MTKVRGFSIVFHNVNEDAKQLVEEFSIGLKPKQYLIAKEEYPEMPNNYHIHLFIQFVNPRQFKPMLAAAVAIGKQTMTVRPEGEERDWGRVEVDQMRGSWAEATAYLTHPNKNKGIDTSLINKKINKFDRICDVCGVSGNYIYHFKFDYPDRQYGRCNLCSLVPHRMLVRLGHNVRNLDQWLEPVPKNKIFDKGIIHNGVPQNCYQVGQASRSSGSCESKVNEEN